MEEASFPQGEFMNFTDNQGLPKYIKDENSLNEVMTRPTPQLIDWVKTLPDPLLILGAGGKMGPTLSVLAKRAAEAAGNPLSVIAVSRFSDPQVKNWLESMKVETLCLDLLDNVSYSALPDADNVIYMVGLKFGTSQNPGNTWVMNTLVPAYVAERYPKARIAALSTGNVYPLVPVTSKGSRENDHLNPIGEYGNACLARERIFEYYSQKNGTPIVLIRLNYAVDLRYGVLVDIAQKVYSGDVVDVTTGYFNCIWQGDANDIIIRTLSLADSPAKALNLSSTKAYSIRSLTKMFSSLMSKEARIGGNEAQNAFLSDTSLMREIFGEPTIPIETVVQWTAEWIKTGRRTLNKPTHFEVRDGKY
jgi:nucleoside-diphosphate-sugar epimerase